LDVSGKQQPHPIDDPLRTFYQLAMSDSEERFVGNGLKNADALIGLAVSYARRMSASEI
jgi:hypothetical protein